MMLLDNTVLSNFALVNQIELLTKALGSQVATTPQVIDEFNDGVVRGRLPETKLDWLEVINLETEEETLFQELLMRVKRLVWLWLPNDTAVSSPMIEMRVNWQPN